MPADPECLLRLLRGLVERFGARYALTIRERQLLCADCARAAQKSIASELGCSAKTVEEYRQRMFVWMN